MIIRENTVLAGDQYLKIRTDLEDAFLFDIETTGFKAKTSQLYLIGVAQPLSSQGSGAGWQITQFFAESPSDEANVLAAFIDYCQSRKVVIHFNGDRFDIPYIQEKCQQFGLISPFIDLISIDMFADFKPLKKLLGLSHMNQISLELFLGLTREDQYDGGELIKIYKKFVKLRKVSVPESPSMDAELQNELSELLELLLLHNREDVSGMLTLSGMYAFGQLLDTSSVYTPELVEMNDGTTQLLIRWELSLPLPQTFFHQGYAAALRAKGRTVTLMLPVLENNTVRFYYEDYKNYYYLPDEDYAIHKSIASYVDSDHRVKATKETCYSKVSLPEDPGQMQEFLKKYVPVMMRLFF